jgi:hypothetical protein
MIIRPEPTIAIYLFGDWRIVNRECFRKHGPLRVCEKCVYGGY